MKVLITGSTGFLGPYLMDAFKVDPENTVCGISRSGPSDYKGDLTKEGIVELLMVNRPDLVIHAAAATNVDWCQKNPLAAYATNVKATRNLVKFLKPSSKLVYISSDMVYSGPGPHFVGGHTVNPINSYGMTKFFGELEAEKHPNHLILRTNIYGLARSTGVRSSLVDFLIGTFNSGLPLNIFTDVMFSPLHVVTLCNLIRQMVMDDTRGVHNLGSSNGISKAKFALLLASNLGLSAAQALTVESISGDGRAPRPKDMRMVTEIATPTIEDDLAEACRSWHL